MKELIISMKNCCFNTKKGFSIKTINKFKDMFSL